MRANLTATLDQRQDGLFALTAKVAALTLANVLVLLFAADKGFVGLYDLAAAAHGREASFTHRLTNAVRHEPSGFVGHAQHAV